jgi:uncharacterized protein
MLAAPMRLVPWLFALVACGSAPPPVTPPPAERPAEPSEPSGIPSGYVDARVMQVVATDTGGVVLLLDETTLKVLPIFIGGTEATSIDFRLRGVTPPRPLTHDLLDAMVRRLKGSLVKVQVDALRDDVFVGSVFVRTGRQIIKIDARPSDALALAIGNKIPIYVAQEVMEQAGVAKDEILRQLTPPAGTSA